MQTDNLLYGSYNKDVLEVQKKLKKIGYDINPTGFFDETMQSIIKDFQTKQFVHGNLNQETLLALEHEALKQEKLHNHKVSFKYKDKIIGIINKIKECDLHFSRQNISIDTLIIMNIKTIRQSWDEMESFHYVISRGGDIIQFVDTANACFGFGGYAVDNRLFTPQRSIQIALENSGEVFKNGTKYYHDDKLTIPYDVSKSGVPHVNEEETDDALRYWAPYFPIQKEKCTTLIKFLREEGMDFKHVVLQSELDNTTNKMSIYQKKDKLYFERAFSDENNSTST